MQNAYKQRQVLATTKIHQTTFCLFFLIFINFSDPDVEEDDLPEEEYEPLETTVIDEFAANALTGCLSLLDSLPDSVYRVCDLLLAVFNRNGPDFKETILKSLINEVHEAVRKLNEATNNVKSFVEGDLASKAAVRIHLFTLLFEECKVLAAKIVDESNIVMAMTHLLSNAPKVLQGIDVEKKDKHQITPKWMTPLLLFIDLHEKVILGMNRRTALGILKIFPPIKWSDSISQKFLLIISISSEF